MAKVKKRKRKLGARAKSGGTSGKKITPLRPYRDPKTAPSILGCPIENDIRGALAFVGASERCERDYDQAFEQAFHIFAKTNPMPATIGRLCIRCCERECNRQFKDVQVNNRMFERYVGDSAIDKGVAFPKPEAQRSEGKIAVVGSGPSGLSCAYHLARRGWPVTIFESKQKPGGLLRYVAPFRLPAKVLDAEIQRILDLGVELKTGVVVGKDVTIEQLQAEYKAVFVAVGAHKERELSAAWQADNVLSGVEFFRRIDAGESVDLGDDVLVVGGWNGTFDAARASKRLGAKTTVIYSRTKDEMPAFPEVVEEAAEEGIDFELLARPLELVKDGNKAVKLLCQRYKLGKPDDRGRRRPVPIRGETFERSFSTLISTLTEEPNYASALSRVGLSDNPTSTPGQFSTSIEGVYIAGDSNKLDLITTAIGQGRRVAEQIHADLTGDKDEPKELPIIYKDKLKLEWYPDAARQVRDVAPLAERMGDGSMTVEANVGLGRDKAIEEAKRCFSCGMCMDCDNCWMYCQDQAVEKLGKDQPVGEHYSYKHELCTGCEKCAEECPCGYLKMV